MDQLLRTPAVAGSFYPDSGDELRLQIERWWRRMPPAPDPPPRALVVPHAGYEYSGETAARGFALVRDAPFHHVVLLAPSHYDSFSFASVFSGDAYQTPLGLVQCSRDLARALAGMAPVFRLSLRGHSPSREHALEVQLPFLQLALNRFELVAVAVGDLDAGQIAQAGEALARLCAGGETLLVASSDLSHFHPRAAAEELDQATVGAIEAGDTGAFLAGVGTGRLEACGAAPVAVAMSATAGRRWRLIHYSNSGDVLGERGAVVGYAALAVC
ncbi:MAG: AmmeMemoRadiSam system protein B [Acidobacteria bacterium]|nr:AmmeMemoRadiSam system protein B [Acidobacteriota bacterium]